MTFNRLFPIPTATLRALAGVSFVLISCFGCSGEGGSSKQGADKETLLAGAQQDVAAGRLDLAEQKYRSVLRTAADDPVALRQLGLLYSHQRQLALAFPILKQLAERQPDDAEVQLSLGVIYLLVRDFARAREAGLKALEKRPGQVEALLLLADAATTPQAMEETKKLVEELQVKDQERASYHVFKGMLAKRQNKDAEAEREFRRALELDPKEPTAMIGMAIIYWAQNDARKARETFKAAVDESPELSPLRLRYVDFLISTGALSDAKAFVEDAAKKLPGYLPPQIYLMRLACAEKQDENCTARVQNVLAQAPTDYDALLISGNLSFAKGEYGQAIRSYQQALNFNGDRPQALFQLARALLMSAPRSDVMATRNAIDNAEKLLTTAVNLDPKFEQAITLLAELKIRKGSSPAAIDLLLPLTQQQTQRPEAHLLLAAAYLAQQNRDGAVGVYRRLSELFPQRAQYPSLAAAVLVAQGKLGEARDAFERSLHISADFAPAIEGLIDLDISERNYKSAVERANAQIGKNPAAGRWWSLRGKVELAQGDRTKAEADLAKAIELDPELQPAYEILAQLYMATNRPKEAIQKLKAFSEKRKATLPLMLLAAAQTEIKDYQGAAETYKSLLTVAPTYAPALNNLAILSSERLDQPTEAFEYAKKARDAAPNDPTIADTLAWQQFKRGEYVEAAKSLTEAVAKVPNNPEIQFHYGMSQYMLGDEAQARTALQKAVEDKSDSAFKTEASRRLALLNQTASTEAELQSFLKDYPNDPLAMTRLASLQQRSGDVQNATKAYEKVLLDYPAFAPALRNLALIYTERAGESDIAKGFELATKARQAYPSDPGIAKTLGILSYRRDSLPRASDLLKEAATRLPDDAEVQYYLGQTYRQLKQLPDCKAALERAISLNVPAALAEEAKKGVTECTEASR